MVLGPFIHLLGPLYSNSCSSSNSSTSNIAFIRRQRSLNFLLTSNLSCHHDHNKKKTLMNSQQFNKFKKQENLVFKNIFNFQLWNWIFLFWQQKNEKVWVWQKEKKLISFTIKVSIWKIFLKFQWRFSSNLKYKPVATSHNENKQILLVNFSLKVFW